jgi:CubicO group peptidase (beta-lactamase class C family)
MKIQYALLCAASLTVQPAMAEGPSAFGSGFDVQDFYLPFTAEDITPQNMQKWPYYKHVSAHWDDYAVQGTEMIAASTKPAILEVAEDRLDLNTEYKDGKSYIDSLVETQVKGFVVMKDNRILTEYYDNGFNLGDTNLLQSASKTFTGIIASRMIDEGLLDPKAKVSDYLDDFEGSSVGAATVQQVLDMTSGIPQLVDFHTPGAEGYIFEIEQGLKAGKTTGHRNAIKSSKAVAKPGTAWNYSDKNTDTLALLSEKVSGKKFSQLLTDLFDAFGANDGGSIAKNSDGTFTPAYGISCSARDYALFHQWIAQGKAPKSYYPSVTDPSKTKFRENTLASSAFPGVRYGSQSYYIAEDDVIYSSGSFGQQGYSDLKTGVSVVFLSDWAVNWEVAKGNDNRARAIAIINHLRVKDDPGFLRSVGE